MSLIGRAIFNRSRNDVDKELHKMLQPGWYDVYTTLRLTHQTDCATYCTKMSDYLELLREVAHFESQNIE